MSQANDDATICRVVLMRYQRDLKRYAEGSGEHTIAQAVIEQFYRGTYDSLVRALTMIGDTSEHDAHACARHMELAR